MVSAEWSKEQSMVRSKGQIASGEKTERSVRHFYAEYARAEPAGIKKC